MRTVPRPRGIWQRSCRRSVPGGSAQLRGWDYWGVPPSGAAVRSFAGEPLPSWASELECTQLAPTPSEIRFSHRAVTRAIGICGRRWLLRSDRARAFEKLAFGEQLIQRQRVGWIYASVAVRQFARITITSSIWVAPRLLRNGRVVSLRRASGNVVLRHLIVCADGPTPVCRSRRGPLAATSAAR
jgi:hypothetical protein